MGALGGVPASARADANRNLALARRREIADLIANRGYTYRSGTYERVRMPIPEAWEVEDAYLARVVSGDVQLYLYDPDRDSIIEMFGSPDDADVILSFMPGTNTTMESFYTSSKTTGITALTRWEIDNAPRDRSVAGFVVKQGVFPQLSGDLIQTGPQNNDMMEALGRSYADFTFEMNAIAPETPIVSIEHSAGSAAGGAAEDAGAHFTTRVALAGIGMSGDWEPQNGTEYYAMQAPNDINRNFDGAQWGNWGYDTPPTAANGFTELDSGIPGTSPWVLAATPISPPIAFVAEASSQLDHHNQIISGDADNRVVQAGIARLLTKATAP